MEKKNNGGERLTDKDLLTEVFSRLDVKSLLISKAVSKTWCSLISSPCFIKSHYQRAVARCCKEDETLIVRHCLAEYVAEDEENEVQFSLLQLNSGQNMLPDLKNPYPQGKYPVEPYCELIGCHFGIVCVSVSISVSDFSRKSSARNQTDIYLWNPATRQSKLIPSQEYYWDRDTIGFGFDDIGNDFKIVRVVASPHLRGYGFYVYSANTNMWRTFENHTIHDASSFVFELHLRGVLYCRNYCSMVAFNLNREQFGCLVQLPYSSLDGGIMYDSCITDFQGSIAVITPLNRGAFSKNFDLWTLNNDSCLFDGEVEASWNIMFRIEVGVPVGYVEGYFNRGDFLCHFDDPGWFVYNSEKKVVTYVPTYIIPTQVSKYTESLISIAGSTPVN
ncbi:F-box domain-containing protein [Heracleum sosnowskyi]|uniref:F-box domain-containing protein n=1 Tax=Heracleum sosnowskyi TaxID=360622 RepID=A0AAD8HAH2_9APIA|nr:F-box domain-containing protein [Heracleum sosnowskyi]KAK1362937.1 F-box domain-containing protein [Heracleum sosnowskyi]